MSVSCVSPRAQYLAHKAEIDAAVRRVLDEGRYILGEEVRAFEAEFARFLGAAHAIGVGSGTEALHLALVACGVSAGDEVVTVSHTAVATVAAIELCGATPVLVDIDPRSYTMDPRHLEAAATARTRAIVPVHLYGHPADIAGIAEFAARRGLLVVEDCAQAHGAAWRGRRVGTFGDAACFSFYPTKNLGAIGDGGAVVCRAPELAERARALREYGWRERYVSAVPGWNSRLDELQAAILRVKLRSLEAANARRAALAARYSAALAGCALELPSASEEAGHVYHLYVVRCRERERFREWLSRRDIGTLVHYPVPVHLQPAYRDRLRTVGEMAQTELAAAEVVSLPMYPELTFEEQDLVIDAVRSFAPR